MVATNDKTMSGQIEVVGGYKVIQELQLPFQVGLELPVTSSGEEPSCRVMLSEYLLSCSDEWDRLLLGLLGLAALYRWVDRICQSF